MPGYLDYLRHMTFGRRATAGLALVVGVTFLAPAAAGAADSTRIAFQRDADAQESGIWVKDLATGAERRVTPELIPAAAPAWSPSGEAIVYACAPGDNWEICSIDVDRGNLDPVQLTYTAVDEFDPAYSPDGQWIVFETYASNGLADIAALPATGGVPRRLARTPTIDEQDPTVDARQGLAFDRGGEIAVVNAESTSGGQILTRGKRTESDPSFSIKNKLVFSRQNPQGRSDLAAADLRKTPRRSSQPRSKASATTQPRRLASTRGRFRRPSRTRRSAYTAPKPVTATSAADELEPAWSADGTKIYFAGARPGARFQIFAIADRRGSRRRQITPVGRYDDFEPALQPVVSRATSLRIDATLALPRLRLTVLWSPLVRAPRVLAQGAAACKKRNGRVLGTRKNDCLRGGEGSDQLWGYKGRDSLDGRGGNDSLHAKDNEADYVNGGRGRNQAWVDPKDEILAAVKH